MRLYLPIKPLPFYLLYTCLSVESGLTVSILSDDALLYVTYVVGVMVLLSILDMTVRIRNLTPETARALFFLYLHHESRIQVRRNPRKRLTHQT